MLKLTLPPPVTVPKCRNARTRRKIAMFNPLPVLMALLFNVVIEADAHA